MCLYTHYIDNPRYKPNKKNRGIIPPVFDKRVLTVPIGCGNCIECLKQKARNWKLRLLEHIKDHKNGIFVTLTFSTENLIKLKKDVQEYALIDGKRIRMDRDITGYDLDNAICTRAVRLFTERWRKKFKVAPKHWLISELGHGKTEHVHLHGIIFTNEFYTEIHDKWNYGFTWLGDEINSVRVNYVNESTVLYITKYVTKQDIEHPNYKPIILASNGIGAGYIKRHDNKFKYEDTNEAYRTSTGHKISLPPYWRNKLWTEEEREILWCIRLDKEERFIMGERIKAYDTKALLGLLEYHRKINRQLGYGSDKRDLDKVEQEKKRRDLIMDTRIKLENDRKSKQKLNKYKK